MPEPVYYLNGRFCSKDQALISPLDRAFLMGDAIYEVVRVQNSRLFCAPAHYDRMATGLNALSIPNPLTREQFLALLLDLARRNNVVNGSVYLQITRGVTARTHLMPKDLTPTLFGCATSLDVIPPWKPWPNGVPVVTFPDIRWGRCDLKTTMLLPNSMGKQKAKDAHAFEAIFVAQDGTVREGTSSSLMAVWGGALRGHPMNQHVLPGITRQLVVKLAKQDGIKVIEEPFSLDQLLKADEAFLTGTTTDIAPIATVDGRPLAASPGPLTRRLMALYDKALKEETGG